MSDDIELRFMTLLKHPAMLAEGRVVWARFTCIVRGFRLEDCALVHREDKGWTIWSPSARVWLPKDVKAPLKAMVMERYQVEKAGA